MKQRAEYIQMISKHADELKSKFGIRSLRLFGSVSRNEQHEGSDVARARILLRQCRCSSRGRTIHGHLPAGSSTPRPHNLLHPYQPHGMESVIRSQNNRKDSCTVNRRGLRLQGYQSFPHWSSRG